MRRHKNGLPNKSLEKLANIQGLPQKKMVPMLTSENQVFLFGTKKKKKKNPMAYRISDAAQPDSSTARRQTPHLGDLFSFKNRYKREAIEVSRKFSIKRNGDSPSTRLLSYEPVS